MSTPKGGTVLFLSLQPELYSMLKELAAAEGLTTPAFVRKIALQYTRTHRIVAPRVTAISSFIPVDPFATSNGL